MKQIAADIAIQKRFLVAGARVLSSTPEEAIAFANKERAMWKDVVALSGLKAAVADGVRSSQPCAKSRRIGPVAQQDRAAVS